MSRSQKAMDNNKRGKFLVQVKASNPDGLSSTSVVEVRHFHPYNLLFIHSVLFILVIFYLFLVVLQLLTVDSSYRVSLRFSASVSEVNENLPKIRG